MENSINLFETVPKEDEQLKREDDTISTEEDVKDSGRISSPRMVSAQRLVTIPPVPRNKCPQSVGGMVPEKTGRAYSLSMDAGGENNGQTRALVMDDLNCSDVDMKDETIGRQKSGYITINGVNLMELQKFKRILTGRRV